MPHNTRNLRAILIMLGAVIAFSAMDALLKLFSEHYPPLQVTAMRGAASLPFLLLSVGVFGRFRDLLPVRYKLHLVRGAVMLVTMLAFIYAIRVLSLADAYSIFLAAPLLITALSVPLLGERVGWHRWVAICIGMIGVLIMLRPSGSAVLTLGAVAAFISAWGYALSAIILRVQAKTETASSCVFSTLLLFTVCGGALAAPEWVPLRTEHFGWLVAVGLAGIIGQHFITAAFRMAPPAVVAPFEYTALIWGMAIDWAVWEVLPAMRVYFGGGIVIATGLYLVWRERVAAASMAH